MPTNVGGDSARLFPWQMVHYIVHGGPNDTVVPIMNQGTPPVFAGTSISGAGSADGCYLSSWKTTPAGVTSVNFISVPPLPGSVAGPPYIPIPRSQQMYGGTGGASLAPGTLTVTNNTGGVYLGTIPQGAWLESIDMYVYSAFTGNAGVVYDLGVFYVQANAYNSSNTPGYQPVTVYPLAFVTGTAATANTFFSTETGIGTAWTNTTITLGPGIGFSNFVATSLASVSDIDLYFIAFCSGTAGTFLATGSAAVRIKFTGLSG